MKSDFLRGLALFAAVLVVYAPAWWAGFFWDDGIVLTDNPCMAGLAGLKEIWTTRAADICPLTLTTFWIEHQLWGFAPLPYHIVNVLLQGGCAILLWRVLLRLKIPGAWFGAALWALHPAQVESVAWISEMKNTESGLFFLLAILFFLRAAPDRLDRLYVLSLLFGALAMMSKSSTVILPVVLALCLWWRGRGRLRFDAVRISPVLAMGLVVGLLSLWTQKVTPDAYSQWTQTPLQRVASAGDAVWFYLGKILWPSPLMLIYPRWQIDAAQWTSYLPTLFALSVLVILWIQRRSWARPWLFAWSYFLVALLPALGLLKMSFEVHSQVSDHFQYLAAIGPLALVAAGFTKLARMPLSWSKPLAWSLGAGLLLAVGIISCQRAALYGDDAAIWADNVAKNPNSWGAHNNLGNALLDRHQNFAAENEYRKTFALNPLDAAAHFNLGRALDQDGDPDAAIAEFHEALKGFPDYADAYNSMGICLLKENRLEEAREALNQALAIEPNHVKALNNLAIALERLNRPDEAITVLHKSLSIDPNDPSAHTSLGLIFAMKGDIEQAIAEYREALRLSPGYPSAEANLRQAEQLSGQKPTP